MFWARGTHPVEPDALSKRTGYVHLQDAVVDAMEDAANGQANQVGEVLPAQQGWEGREGDEASGRLGAGASAGLGEDPGGEAGELAIALGMVPVLPELPPNFRDVALSAIAGDIQAIAEMRAIGDMVPAHLQIAFAEMVEEMIDSPSRAR